MELEEVVQEGLGSMESMEAGVAPGVCGECGGGVTDPN